jgi:hypothetical protein
MPEIKNILLARIAKDFSMFRASFRANHDDTGQKKRKQRCCRSRHYLSFVGLFNAPDIHRGEGYLEANNRQGLSVPSPGDPQDVAEERTPKAGIAPALGLESQQPDRKYVDHHRGPL